MPIFCQIYFSSPASCFLLPIGIIPCNPLSGHTECSLIAHDWGAVIAWYLVEKYPSLFKRHVSINGPHHAIYKQVMRSNFDQFLKSWWVVSGGGTFSSKWAFLQFNMNDKWRFGDRLCHQMALHCTSSGRYVFFFQCPFLPELLLSLNDFEALAFIKGTKNIVEAFSNEVIEAYKYYAGKKGIAHLFNLFLLDLA